MGMGSARAFWPPSWTGRASPPRPRGAARCSGLLGRAIVFERRDDAHERRWGWDRRGLFGRLLGQGGQARRVRGGLRGVQDFWDERLFLSVATMLMSGDGDGIGAGFLAAFLDRAGKPAASEGGCEVFRTFGTSDCF